MLFVSHASQDRAAIEKLLTTLRRAGQRVWLDDELGGGEAWWRAILEQVRGCEVFLIAVSNHSLASKPCQAELRYAQALQRPILPVQIGPIDSVRVTPLATTQILDYRRPSVHADRQLIDAVHRRRQQPRPVRSALPEEPPVPFAYLMRLATALDSPDLTRHQQTELVSELKSRLDEDRNDPAARRDIARLLCLLHDRPDVTWRTRTEIDNVLASTGIVLASSAAYAESAATDPITVPNTNPQPLVTAQVSGPEAASTGKPAAGRARRPRTRWVTVGGIGLAVTAALVAVPALRDSQPAPPESFLLGDAEIDAIMGTSGMEAVEGGGQQVKSGSLVEVSPQECMGVVYPGLDRTYQGSGHRQLTWNVLEKPGGLQRAGVNTNPFVDQDVTEFPPETDQAFAFVQASTKRWRTCGGQTVTATYPDHSTYTWTVGDFGGEAPKLAQWYTQEGDHGYACQRILSAVSNLVIDVKACGQRMTDQADRIADRIAASVTQTGNPGY